MDKTEFKKIVKHEFEKYGFKFKGNIGHKMHQENYLIGIDMEHFNFVDAYCISYGVVYLPDEEKFPPFKGFYDWHDDFLFTKTSFDNIYNYSIYHTYYNDNLTTHFF